MESIILEAEEKLKCKRPHTSRESFIAMMGRRVMAHLASTTSVPSSVLYTDGDRFLDISSFVNTETVMCRTFNVITGELIEFPLMEWLTQKHYTYLTLVLHGDAGLGKTPLAMSLAAAVTDDIWEKPSERPYFLKIETIDSLREATSVNLSLAKKGVPILFDDIEPCKVRGTRKGNTLEDLKHICEVTNKVTLHARFKDIVLDENEPRLFTSNAMNPHDWHDGLPKKVFDSADAVRMEYSAGIKAVFKRVCFAHVKRPLISEDMRKAFDLKRRRVV